MKYIKAVLKIMFAGCTAVIILSCITAIYSTNPLRIENDKLNTDYKWEPNSIWLNMSEGISHGEMDAQGFNNLEVIDDPDILILGSSHFEAKNVNQTENVSTLLAEKFCNQHNVYNMGISGHDLYKVCQYLPESAGAFQKSPKYIIIETSSVNLDEANVDAVLKGEVEKTKVYSAGSMASLQRIPAFRLLYHQWDSGLDNLLFPVTQPQRKESAPVGEQQVEIEMAPYEKLFSYLRDIQDDSGSKLIIVYHPFETLHEDGSISFTNEYTSVFAEVSGKYGIAFIDMTSDFEKMFQEEHHVPHGFVTGEIGAGHLNKYGHQAIAERLYETICESEE